MADENDSYYPEDDSAPSTATDESPAPEGEDGDDQPKDGEKMEGETALLPKSILAGKDFKPGEEVVLKVVHLYDDEVEVAYATGKDEDENVNKGEPTPAMDEAMDKMGSY